MTIAAVAVVKIQYTHYLSTATAMPNLRTNFTIKRSRKTVRKKKKRESVEQSRSFLFSCCYCSAMNVGL